VINSPGPGRSDAARQTVGHSEHKAVMATQTSVETVSTGADKAKLAGGRAAGRGRHRGVFYVLGKQDLWLRVVALLVLLAAAMAVFLHFRAGQAADRLRP
jgi:predicted lactoylglutathione lyase